MSRARTSALLVLACTAALAPATVAHAQAPACPGATTPAVAGNEALMDQATLCLLNQQRAAAGLPALNESPQLDQSSTAYSRQMVAERFFDHVSPEGVGLVPRLTTAGYLPGGGAWNAGENIAWGQGFLATPQSIMTAWMNSAGHRENILSPAFVDVGLGVAIGSPVGDTTAAATYTTDFGRHVSSSHSATTTLSPYTPPGPAVKVTVRPGNSHGTTPAATPKKKPHVATRCARTAKRHGRSAKHLTRTCRAARRHAAKR